MSRAEYIVGKREKGKGKEKGKKSRCRIKNSQVNARGLHSWASFTLSLRHIIRKLVQNWHSQALDWYPNLAPQYEMVVLVRDNFTYLAVTLDTVIQLFECKELKHEFNVLDYRHTHTHHTHKCVYIQTLYITYM